MPTALKLRQSGNQSETIFFMCLSMTHKHNFPPLQHSWGFLNVTLKILLRLNLLLVNEGGYTVCV